MYLRAFYKICWREFSSSLDDFYVTLERLEVQLVPDSKSVLHACMSSRLPGNLNTMDCSKAF